MEGEELDAVFDEITDDSVMEKGVSDSIPMIFMKLITWIMMGIGWLIMMFLCCTVGMTYWK